MNSEGVGRFVSGLACLAAVAALAWLVVLSVVPGLFGWRTVSLTSGSMTPALHVGDIVIARPSTGQHVKLGTVAVFKDPAGDGLITHRIVARNPDGTYVTKGDANQVADSTPLPPKNIVGTARLMVPKVGLPAAWIHNGEWANVATLGVVIGFVLWHTRYAVTRRHDPWHVEGPVERRTTRVTRVLVAAALVEIVVGSGALVATQSARAAWAAPVSNGQQFFAAAPYHQYYLSSAGYPSFDYPFSAIDTPPTQTTLADYYSDTYPGLTIAKGGFTAAYWSRKVTPGVMDFNAPTRLRMWSSAFAFDPVSTGSVTAELLDCKDQPPSSTCVPFATTTVTSNGSWNDGSNDWVEKTWDFGTPNYTVPHDHWFAVRVTVPSTSPVNIMLAYDTTTYRSAVQIG